jgi:hypothetical protein
MGRSGIRRRKPKHRLPPAEDTGILDDLHDQAEWSSYGQGIPRLGNPRRDAIWWRRGWRYYRNLGRIHSNPQIHDAGFWPAILLGSVGVVIFIALAILVLIMLGRIL